MRRTVSALLLLLAAAVARADTIRFVDGRKPLTEVEVLDETLEGVRYRIKNVRQIQTLPAEKVLAVEYAKVPEDYEIAQDNMDAGAFQAAAELFLAAAQDASRKKGLAAKCYLLAGDAYLKAGLYEDAMRVFDDLVAKFPESRYAPEARLKKGIALVKSGQAQRARQVFSALEREAGKVGARWALEAKLQLLRLDEAKDPKAALEAYEGLLKEAGSKYPTVAHAARLRIGRVLTALGRYDEAIAAFREILAKRSDLPREIVAGAFNGLGTALRSKPNATPEELKEALYAHLRVFVSYPDVVDEQPEALYGAGKCFQKVPVQDAEARAQWALGKVVREYPNSVWAKKARQG